jgi:hypothetical protein
MSYLRQLIVFICACSIFEANAIGPSSESSLCTPRELVVFSCTARGKTVSLCRSSDLTQESGYMQYRFGSRSKKVELEYPDKEAHPSKTFVAGNDGGAKWSVDYLKFSKEEFEYLVFMQRAAFDANGGGVIVKRNGRKVTQLVCPRNRIKDELYSLDLFGIRPPQVDALEYQEDVSGALKDAKIRD